MGLNSKIIQRISNATTSNIAHSSGFAKAQQNSESGSTGYTSFSTRQSIDQNRKMIQGYRNSQLARGVNHMPRARTFKKDPGTPKNGVAGSSLNKGSEPTSPHGTAHYTESIRPNFKANF